MYGVLKNLVAGKLSLPMTFWGWGSVGGGSWVDRDRWDS